MRACKARFQRWGDCDEEDGSCAECDSDMAEALETNASMKRRLRNYEARVDRFFQSDGLRAVQSILATPSQPDHQSRGQAFDGEGEGSTKWKRLAASIQRNPPMTTKPNEPEAMDRALFSQIFGVLPSAAPIDQKALKSIVAFRLQSVAAATAAKDAEIAELAEAVRCIMARCEALEDEASNGIATTSANVRDDTHEAGFWRGQKSTAKSIREHLHDMTRAALSEAREAGE